MERKKRNQIFQYLEAIGILMVIDDHTGTTIGILSELFPYNSFYMPMFVFISGYFYKDNPIGKNIGHKAKHLLLPYLMWGGVGDLIAWLLLKVGLVNWYVSPFSITDLMMSLTLISLTPITDPSWFVVMLFWVSFFYTIIRNLFHINSELADYIFWIANVLIGMWLISLCMRDVEQNLFSLFFIRTFWYMQFYHAGLMFHRYWEEKVARFPTLISCCICALINLVLLCAFGDSLKFNSTAWMASFHSCWLPVITSITGIIFWYKAMQFLSEKIGQVQSIDYLAENTFTIMCSHFFFSNIPKFYPYLQCLHRNPLYKDFPVKAFYSNPWLGYWSRSIERLGFFCGLFGSLLTVCFVKKCKKFLENEY